MREPTSLNERPAEDFEALFLAPVIIRLCFRYGLLGEAAPLGAERYEFFCFLFEQSGLSPMEIDQRVGEAIVAHGGLWKPGSPMIRWESARIFSPSRMIPIEANFLSAPIAEPLAELAGLQSEPAALERIARLAKSAGEAIALAARPAGWAHLKYCESELSINSELGRLFEGLRGLRIAELSRQAIEEALGPAPPAAPAPRPSL